MPAIASTSAAWWVSSQVSGAEGSERPGAALVDQQQPAAIAERVEVGAEHRVVEPGAAVQDEERELARAALGHVQARVTDVDEHRRTLSSV